MVMAPKRKEKETQPEDKSFKIEQIQSDHELFLQAFEKPTQIYRYLRSRNFARPMFLHRNLTYMKTKKAGIRKSFKVDKMLEKLSGEIKVSKNDKLGHMNLFIRGLFDKRAEPTHGPVTVEIQVVNINHKKRKEVASPALQSTIGKFEIPVNPSENDVKLSNPITIPPNMFAGSNGHQIKSHLLLFKVSRPGYNFLNDEGEEPACKKRRNGKMANEEGLIFGGELTVYDKQGRGILTEGDYEISLKEVLLKQSPRKNCTWENISEGADKLDTPLELFKKHPCLKFSLRWSKDFINDKTCSVVPVQLDNQANKENLLGVSRTKEQSKIQIYYQFFYNSNSRQQTQAREDFICPWCSINCKVLYSLLKHLKLCHPRFTFTYVPHPKGARIDVAINECFDGSYSGNPQDIVAQPPGFAFSRNGPVRRTSVSHILVCHPQRPTPSLSEFLEEGDTEFEGQRPFIVGHNRLYHHAKTCLPIQPRDFDVDPEAENDPEWLRIKTQMMIDDFTDVNDGEKELMKLWNLHVLKWNYVGDCQIPLAATMFLEANGDKLLQKNLYRNFVLHLCNMYDFGLIPPSVVLNTVRTAQSMMISDRNNSWEIFKSSVNEQLEKEAKKKNSGNNSCVNL